ncbi:cell division cycle protein 27 homolog B isoform X2 [Punica granatum]|uniref:Cell division cycle protein 27 homolog B isoform X2 n=1 Tax=Punica granatum TaxID=22663 RepID=A0A6P8CJZ2_PUNGR|nr:cell division cycle protein 27 homolog B isoform X2 [Punica granatum]
MKKTKTKPQISLLSLSLSLSLSESKMKEEAMEAILRNTVQNSLRHFMYKNAIFFSEFLCAEFPSEANLQLLASCYLQDNRAQCAYHILKGTQMAQSRYLFALSCFQMDLLNEAEAALCPANEPIAEVPNGGAGHYLLGLVYRYTDRRTNAVHHFKQALSLDPLLWTAYEELCILGAAEEAAAVFGEGAAICIQKQYLHHTFASHNSHVSEEDRNLTSSRNLVSAEEVSPRQLKQLSGNNVREVPGSCQGMTTSVRGAGQPPNGVYHLSLYNTPSPIATQFSAAAPPPLCRNLQPNGSNTSTAAADSSPRSTINSTIQAPRRKFVDEGKLRKISGRLFSDSGPRRSTRLAAEAGANAGTNAASVAGNGTNNSSKYLGSSKLSSAAFRSVTVRKVPNWANENFDEGMRNEVFDDCRSNIVSGAGALPSVDNKALDQEGATMPCSGVLLNNSKVLTGTAEILSLLRLFGEGYRLSCMYRCQDALEVYSKLPHKHYNTGWVLSQHLKEGMKLSYLARELISTDRLAPQSWCAIGNCYSLQKDHETALKNFQRAVQLDSKFAYAHTLCAHEYVALEEFENGIRSYQSALRIDSRHYNAWYGLGMVYLRQEKFEFAEHHFRTACRINPSSSIIMSYLGTALHALKRNSEALEMMERAILADRKNPLPMYQKAKILESLESFDEALEVLEELKEYAPRESSVYALMGMIYKRLNMNDKAMLHFGLALDLKPSATDVATIKAAMEKLHLPDELAEDS